MKELLCAACGVPIHLDDVFYQRFQETGKTFYCLNGHANVFSEPEVKRLRDMRDYLNQEVDRLRSENMFLRHQVNGYRGQITKKNNLINHMKLQHDAEKVTEDDSGQ